MLPLFCAAAAAAVPPQVVGQGIADFVAEGGSREELVVVSKVWNTHHRPEAVR